MLEAVRPGRGSVLGVAQFLRQFFDALFPCRLFPPFRRQLVLDAVHLPAQLTSVGLDLLTRLHQRQRQRI